MSEILLLKTSESTKKKAKYIAKSLIQKKLATCVSLNDIFSIFTWDGKLEEVKEVEIVIKSKPELTQKIICFLKEEISYELPQIIYTSFNSEENYLSWINR